MFFDNKDFLKGTAIFVRLASFCRSFQGKRLTIGDFKQPPTRLNIGVVQLLNTA